MNFELIFFQLLIRKASLLFNSQFFKMKVKKIMFKFKDLITLEYLNFSDDGFI